MRSVWILGEQVFIYNNVEYIQRGPIDKPDIMVNMFQIFANEAFVTLPHHIKETMVAHELGHRELGHHLNPQNLWNRTSEIMAGRVLPCELEADHYAAQLLGKETCLRAMRELVAYIRSWSEYPWQVVRELDLRIEHLEKQND